MIEPPFVDREAELETLERLSMQGTYLPIYLYGPEGCGKTRLLKEFVSRAPNDAVVVYIDALEGRSVDKALVVRGLKKVVDVAAGILSEFVPVGRALAEGLSLLIDALAHRLPLRGKHLVILVDDVAKPVGVERIEWYLKYLQSLIEKLPAEYGVESVAIIATTSEGESLDRVMRHTYTEPRLLWNLSLDHARELLERLSPPREDLVEHVVRLTGGNPRAMVDIAVGYNWRVGDWLRKIRLVRVEPAALEARVRGLVREVLELVENPDAVVESDARVLEAYKMLQRHNLMLYKAIPQLNGEVLKVDVEMGVGRYYAWQMPVYRTLLKELLRGSR